MYGLADKFDRLIKEGYKLDKLSFNWTRGATVIATAEMVGPDGKHETLEADEIKAYALTSRIIEYLYPIQK
ncbi:MAG: hypothetical protein WBF08_09125 [Candidatus Bathyarchaeia archaeon]